MRKSWPTIPLGDVLTPRQEMPQEEDLLSGRVRIVDKIGFNEGRIQLRSDVETKTKMILIRPGDLVVSGINATKGAIAIYGEENENPIAATIHYGAYIPKKDRVEIKYLWWLLRSAVFKNLLMEYVPGGIKTELKPARFLPIPVPMPLLTEQQRIMAQVDRFAAKINEARTLRYQAVAEAEAFIISTHTQLSGCRKKKLGEIVSLEEDAVAILSTGSYPQVGLKSFGGGLFPKGAVSGSETTYRTFNRLYDGALVLSQVKGWEGAVAVCPSNLAGWFVSPEYRTFRCIPTEARPGYLAALVRTEWFWSKLVGATRGVGDRRERTRPEQFLGLEMLMPEVEQQKRGESLFAKVDALNSLQAETAVELDAILPSILDRAFKGGL
ncbi:MAG: restriction endonuclease subunit S [Candidatus Omnitrophica bacterium]|nr:restriction endonuclease subunit S [Candidatus Omnitrophota bacterium]